MVRINLTLATIFTAALMAAAAFSSSLSAATKVTVAVDYGKLPLVFEPNQGQTDERVKFLSRGRGYSLFLTESEAVLSLRGAGGKGHTLRVKLLGAASAPKMTGLARLPGISNYFIGRDRSKWRTNIPHYAKVGYEGVYPGIDLVFYGTKQRQLEYDFVVAPGADPGAILLAFEGAERLEIDESGDLVALLSGGKVHFFKPVVYQMKDGTRQRVVGDYVLTDDRVSFALGAYDPAETLVIDPVLAYSTYLGGTDGDEGAGIAIDGGGNAYVVGTTDSIDFPTTVDAFDLGCGTDGWCNPGPYSNSDAFVTKLSADGSALVYSTYLGGSGGDFGDDIAVDAFGIAYVVGTTNSIDFPMEGVPYQPSLGGGFDAFVTKLSADGSLLVYSTFLGGTSDDYGEDIAVDCEVVGSTLFCNAYVTGSTLSSDFPKTVGAFDEIYSGFFIDAFVTKLSADGSALVYSTYLGGTGIDLGEGIAVDGGGNAYVTGFTDTDFPTTAWAFQTAPGGGYDAFVTKLSADGSALVYSTYLGGGQLDYGFGIAVDCEEVGGTFFCNAYVTGRSSSTDFPTTADAFQKTIGGKNGRKPDAFVAKLSADGWALDYSTYLGGRQSDTGYGIAVDTSGNAYVTGSTGSNSDFPVADPFQPTFGGGVYDAFVTKIDPSQSGSLSLVSSTYLGGTDGDEGAGIAIDGGGNAYVVGTTDSIDFPPAGVPYQPLLGGGDDAFVVKISGAAVTSPPEDPEGGGGKEKPCNPNKPNCN